VCARRRQVFGTAHVCEGAGVRVDDEEVRGVCEGSATQWLNSEIYAYPSCADRMSESSSAARKPLDCLRMRVHAYARDTCASTRKRVKREGRAHHLPDTTGWPWRAWPAAMPSTASEAIRLANTVWMPGGHGPGATSSISFLLVRSHSAPSTNTATCARTRRRHHRRHRTWGRVRCARHARTCTRTRVLPRGQTR